MWCMCWKKKLKWLISEQLQRVKISNGAVLELVPSLLGHLLAYPFKLMRTRLIQQPNHIKYRGIFDCFVKIRQQEGITAIFSGFGLDSVLVFCKLLFYHFAHNPIIRQISPLLPSRFILFATAPAELLLGLVVFPLQTVLVKLQGQVPYAPKLMRPNVSTKSIFQCFKESIEKHGILSLWNGYLGFALSVLVQISTRTFFSQFVWKLGFVRELFNKSH